MADLENQDAGLFKSFLTKVFSLFEGKTVDKQTQNDMLVDYALKNTQSSGEKLTEEDLRVIVDTIDETNEAIGEYYSQDKESRNVSDWGKNKVKEIVKEIDPSLSDADVETEIEKGLNETITKKSEEYAVELAGRELTEDELKEAHKED